MFVQNARVLVQDERTHTCGSDQVKNVSPLSRCQRTSSRSGCVPSFAQAFSAPDDVKERHEGWEDLGEGMDLFEDDSSSRRALTRVLSTNHLHSIRSDTNPLEALQHDPMEARQPAQTLRSARKALFQETRVRLRTASSRRATNSEPASRPSVIPQNLEVANPKITRKMDTRMRRHQRARRRFKLQMESSFATLTEE